MEAKVTSRIIDLMVDAAAGLAAWLMCVTTFGGMAGAITFMAIDDVIQPAVQTTAIISGAVAFVVGTIVAIVVFIKY